MCLRFLVLLNLVTFVGQFIDVLGFFEFQFEEARVTRPKYQDKPFFGSGAWRDRGMAAEADAMSLLSCRCYTFSCASFVFVRVCPDQWSYFLLL